MVASYIFVALLASQVTLAAPVDRKPALVEVDLLNDDSANVLEVDVNSQRKPTLSSRLFGKRALHRTSGSQDEDNNDLLDVTLLEDDEFHHDYLLTVDVGRRTAQTTGDVISGPDAGVPHEPAVRQLRGRAFLASRPLAPILSDELEQRSLLELDIGGHDRYINYVSVDSAAQTPTAAPASKSQASSRTSSSTSSSASSPTPTSDSAGDFVFNPDAIRNQNLKKLGLKHALKAPHLDEATSSTDDSSTDAAPSPTSVETDTVETAVYHEHGDSLLDLDIDLKVREEPSWVEDDGARRPSSLEPLAAVLLAHQDTDRSTPWMRPPVYVS